MLFPISVSLEVSFYLKRFPIFNAECDTMVDMTLNDL